MAKQITVDFQFEIGDLVYMKTAVHDMNSVPKQCIVTGRVAEECSGSGIQKHYHLDGYAETIPELLLSENMPAYQGRCPEFYDEVLLHTGRALRQSKSRDVLAEQMSAKQRGGEVS